MSSSVDIKSMIKGSLIGAGISAGVCAAGMFLTAFILNMISGMPHEILSYIMLGIQGLGVLTGSYIAAAIIKSRGLIIGLITGALIFLIITILGLSSKDNGIGIITLIRAIVVLLLGALGGIKGVNKKERIRIG